MSVPRLRSLDRARLLGALEEHHREHLLSWTRARGGEIRDEGDLLLFVTGAPVEWANGVAGARLTGETADGRISEAAAFLRSRGVPASWWVGPLSTPDDLGDRLLAQGLEPAETLPWMAAPLDPPPEAAPLPPGFEVRMVDDDATQAAWLEAMRVGFGMGPEQVALLSSMAAAVGWSAEGPWVRFACRLDGRPAASSGLLLYGPVAGVYNVATDPAFRRRGLGALMTVTAMRHAAALGYGVAVLGSSDMGRGVYERLGFRDIFREPRYALR